MQTAEKDVEKETPETEAHPLDVHIGQRLRQRRLMLGLTQEKLSNIIGLTFQQVQKYERGYNKVSASRLHEMAHILQVPISYFFEDAPGAPLVAPGMGETEQEPLDENSEAASAIPNAIPTEYNSRETAELLRAYYRIETPGKRRKVLDLVRAMNDMNDED